MNQTQRLSCFALLAALVAGCGPTQVMVGIVTDMLADRDPQKRAQYAGMWLRGVRLEVADGKTNVVSRKEDFSIGKDKTKDRSLPGSWTVYSDETDAPPVVQVTLRGYLGMDAAPTYEMADVTRDVRFRLSAHRKGYVRMALTWNCVGVSCGQNQTCIDGICKSMDMEAWDAPEAIDGIEQALQCPTMTTYYDTATHEPMIPSSTKAGTCASGGTCSEGLCWYPPPASGDCADFCKLMRECGKDDHCEASCGDMPREIPGWDAGKALDCAEKRECGGSSMSSRSACWSYMHLSDSTETN